MDTGNNHAMVTTLCAALAAGIFLTVLCRRLDLPAIILLLGGGVALGPEGLNLVRPASLGGLLPVVVSLAVGLILFEGGLTLDLRGYKQSSRVIKRLLSWGVLITWLLTALVVGLVFRIEPGLALLCGSLVIVTGPTVIVPLLKRIQVNARLHSILHWEGVLIDSVGVFIALLCFEWLIGGAGDRAVANFVTRALSGLAIGVAGGFVVVGTLRTRLVPDDMRNIFTLACAVAIFGLTEAVISEGGLLAVTVAGLVVGWKQPLGLKRVREFKAEITDLLIGLLFILLASRLRLEQFEEFGIKGAIAVALVMLFVRPMNILLSSLGSDLTGREKLFLSWVAPRGIVAASMSSLFAIALADTGAVSQPKLLETFTYSVIVATVVFQGLTAGLFAKLLGLRRPVPTGWLIVGAHSLGRMIAKFIQDEAKLNVLLLDSNPRQIKLAQEEQLPAHCADALDTSILEERTDFQKIRFLLALTDNTELNELLCHRWGDALGRQQVHRWSAIKGDRPESDLTHGKVVLPELPRPSTVSNELWSSESRLDTVTVESKNQPISGQVLFVARNGQAWPTSARPDEKLKPGDRVLVLTRNTGHLATSFDSGDVMDFVTTDLQAVFGQVERSLCSRFEALNEKSLWDTSTGAQRLLVALPGRGAALVHAYSPHLKQRICILARFTEGVPVPGHTQPLRLLFFLLSPEGDAEGYLATLAEFGRFCSQRRNLEALRNFTKASEALTFLRQQRGGV